jgi:hypothetical protein
LKGAFIAYVGTTGCVTVPIMAPLAWNAGWGGAFLPAMCGSSLKLKCRKDEFTRVSSDMGIWMKYLPLAIIYGIFGLGSFCTAY